MEITNEKLRKVVAQRIKHSRLSQNYTQENVAEGCGISIDLIRNIENARNIGSITTILKLCNFLGMTPNELFFEFLDNSHSASDVYLRNQFYKMSRTSRNALKDIIIYLDRKYCK